MLEKKFIYQFIPTNFKYLLNNKKIEHNSIQLKTDLLINIMHELIIKYYITDKNDVFINLWSKILREKYGQNYNIYIDYLVNKGFMFLVSDYYVNKKARTYKLNIEHLYNINKCKITDKVLIKKYQKKYLLENFLYKKNSKIELNIRELLVNDLYHIKLDYDSAIKYLENEKLKKTIDISSYLKNLDSINRIKNNYIYFHFDGYGRMHTNFTVLKKHIRNNFLKIDNDDIYEIDIKNSQPFFLAILLKRHIGAVNFNEEVKRYVDLCINGLIYDELCEKIPDIKSRNHAKIIMYKILFGKNNTCSKNKLSAAYNKYFKQLFPTVFEYIKEFKKNSYKDLSYMLQELESEFIFNVVIKEIKKRIPSIKIFTVHDSINFPLKYKEEVSLIFNENFKKLL